MRRSVEVSTQEMEQDDRCGQSMHASDFIISAVCACARVCVSECANVRMCACMTLMYDGFVGSMGDGAVVLEGINRTGGDGPCQYDRSERAGGKGMCISVWVEWPGSGEERERERERVSECMRIKGG